jgi:hypothetical protein
MQTNQRPDPIRSRDEQGNPIVRVPVDRKGIQWATLDETNFDRLRASGVSLTWFFNDSGNGHSYVKADAPGASGRLVSVPRLIMRAGPKEIVRYVTRDRLDLRRRNLTVAKGKAKRTDGALLSARSEVPRDMRAAA